MGYITMMQKVWRILNSPLVLTILIFSSIFVYQLCYGEDEKVRCDYIINPDFDYLKNELNMTQTMLELYREMYSTPFAVNLTFENYQEALAFLEISNQELEVKKGQGVWYRISLNCDDEKIALPKGPQAAFNDATQSIG